MALFKRSRNDSRADDSSREDVARDNDATPVPQPPQTTKRTTRLLRHQLPKPQGDSIDNEDAPPSYRRAKPTPNDPFLHTLIDGRYDVQSVVAVGGMATVYRAIDRRLERPVAVKIMHPHLSASPNLVQRFRQEARAVAKLSHPGIVNVYDQGVVSGTGYLVMEYVTGPNLRSVLRERGALPVGEAFDLIEQILQALAVAHDANMIHRDVKPENVLLTQSGRAKVADFGLARAVSDQTASTTGSVLGTVAYLAPELISAEDIDARTDIYSVGIMLYEMLAGAPPYHHETAIQVAWSHVNEDVPDLTQTLPWMPPAVAELIADLAARNPEHRPPHAHAALELVKAVHATLPDDVLQRRADVDPQAPCCDEHMPPTPSTTVATPASTIPVTSEQYSAHLDEDGRQQTAALEFGHGTAALPMIVEGDAKPDEHTTHRKAPIIIAIIVVIALLAGTAVWYVLWGPGAYTTVPKLDGRTEANAVKVLKENELQSKVVYSYHDDVDKGKVIGTKPKAGGKIHKKDTVTVEISKGVHYVKVPEVVGQPFDKAKSELSQQTLKLKQSETKYSDDVAKGHIISIDPPAGKTVIHDTTINAVVSKGREPVTVPDLKGKTAAEADVALEKAGLKPASSQELNEKVPRGKIIRQDPEAKTSVFKNDTVTYVVSLGPEMVTVPNLVGAGMDGAKSRLEGLGFKVTVESRPPGIVPGVVFDQSVGGGQQAKNGSTITLYHY